MKNLNLDRKNIIIKVAIVIALAVLAFLSVTKGRDWATSPQTHTESLTYLDEKQSDVMALSATSLSASTALTLIPGDAATPIANELAELSVYFIITICAILLEKGLITVTGYLAFTFLIPAALIIAAGFVIWGKKPLAYLSVKVLAVALAIFILVPVSVQLSQTIENTYTKSVDRTIEDVNRTIEEIESGSEAERFSIGNILSGVTNGVSKTVENIENLLNDFIEQIAIMLVTSCLIPIFVLMLFGWGIKMLLEAIATATRDFGKGRGLPIGVNMIEK